MCKKSNAYFQTAESSKELEDKVGYFALSAECLLASVDHLMGWFTRCDEFTSRKGRRNSFMYHKKIKKLGFGKKNKLMQFIIESETVRNTIFYLHSTDLNEVEYISKSKLKLLLRR